MSHVESVRGVPTRQSGWKRVGAAWHVVLDGRGLASHGQAGRKGQVRVGEVGRAVQVRTGLIGSVAWARLGKDWIGATGLVVLRGPDTVRGG